MHPILRNILSVLAGIFLGSVVNYGILLLGQYFVLLPPGVDLSDPEGAKAAIQLFQPKHFLVPFLAHAAGTFVGAYTAVRLAGTGGALRPALVVSAFFLAAGVQMVMEVPSPLWFNVTDLVFAYAPMALLARKLATRKSSSREAS